jgi:hypothetical protein
VRTSLFALVLCAAIAARAETVIVTARGDVPSCEVHVAGGPVVPCGSAVDANARVHLTGSGVITPYLAAASARAFGNFVPASTVAFPAGKQLREKERIRLVSLHAPRDGETLHATFVVDATALDQRVTMPAGRAIALLLDEKERVLAVSRPVVLRAGEQSNVWPDTPDAAALVARITRPNRDAATLTAKDLHGTHPPDVVVDSAESVLAVWYALEGTTARLAAESKTLHISESTADLRRGTVTTLDAELRVLPSLAITIGALPDTAPAASMQLTIARRSEAETPLQTLAVEPGRTFTLDFVPAAPLAVRLQIGDADVYRSVDLSSGNDATLHIELTPIVVSGVVFRGDTPSAATLRFGRKLQVETDAEGRYSVVMWQAQRQLVEATLPGLQPYTEMVQITSSMTLDLHVPANTLRVRAYDAADQTPIERGEIVVHNRTAAGASVNAVAITSAVQQIPPQRVGTTELRVRVPGYADAGPITIAIDASLGEKTIDVPMTRGGTTRALTILVDGITPAAGAEVAAWEGDRALWLGKADDEGRIDIPDAIAQRRVIVRHPSAASDVVVLGHMEREERLSLRPLAPPLLVRVVRRNGDAIGPAAAMLSISLRGSVRLTGAEAAFATWSFGGTSPDGTILLRGLPRNAIRLFATRKATRAQIETGTFDSLATVIDHPWPATAQVTLVDD